MSPRSEGRVFDAGQRCELGSGQSAALELVARRAIVRVETAG